MCEDEKEECRKLYSQVIGKIDQTLYGGNYENVNINKLYDSNLAQLVQDACIFAVNKLVPKTNSDIVALGGGGGVRKRINSGNATRGDILNAFPFENRLLVKKISPKNIYEVLKPGFKTLYKDNGILKGENNAFPCVGGMRVEVTIPKSSPNLGDSDSSPIQKVVLLDSNGKDKKELNRDDDKPELLLAINDFMAQGGDGYPTFDKYETIAKGNEPTGDVLIHYIEHLTKEYGSIKGYPANMSRIKFIDISSGNYSAEISVSEKFNPDQVTVDGHTTSEWHIMAGGKVIVKDLSSGPHSISAWSNNSHQEFYVNNQIGILKASIYS
jgi:2',3'-cyclic-nucleotide 2'-phosphodiesterase (5'-nucleotidase family)